MFEFVAHLHWGALAQIVLIDVLLGGDNAVVIALACRHLPHAQRMRGIIWGTAGAIAVRVVLAAFALALLTLPFLKLIGGVLLLWIGVKLLLPDHPGEHAQVRGSYSMWGAVRTIILADVVMSIDNVLGIAAAAQNAIPDHRVAYVTFGLLLSVPLIVWGSTLVLRVIDRFPPIVLLGAGLLGWIAGGMMIGDHVVTDAMQWLGWEALQPPVKWVAEVVGALFVMGLGSWLARRRRRAMQRPSTP